MAIFDWDLGRNSAPREGQKMPWLYKLVHEILVLRKNILLKTLVLTYSAGPEV